VLRAGVAFGLQAEMFERHGQQPDGDLLSRGSDHIELARIGFWLYFFGQPNKPVGFARHGRNYDYKLVTFVLEARYTPCDFADTLRRSHRRATVFLNYECHFRERLCSAKTAILAARL